MKNLDTCLSEHLLAHGRGCPLVVLEEGVKSITPPWSYRLNDLLSKLYWDNQKIFKYSVLDFIPNSGPMFADRRLFNTKTSGTKQSLTLHGKYPTEPVYQSYRDLIRIIPLLNPPFILALGSLPLWLLTGKYPITNYRGSEETICINDKSYPVLGTYSYLSLLQQPGLVFDTDADLERIRKSSIKGWGTEPTNFTIPTTYKQAKESLEYLINTAELDLITNDIETQAYRHITCAGFGYSPSEAIVIPFVSKEYPLGYYTLDQEVELVLLIKQLLEKSGKQIANQNYIYDTQFMARMWGIRPRISHDTYAAQSILYTGKPRDLAYLSSHYCRHHVYWKNELDNWKSMDAPDSSLFTYNGKDCTRTYEVLLKQLEQLRYRNFMPQYEEQIANANITLKMIMRGVRKNFGIIPALEYDLSTLIKKHEDWLRQAVPFEGTWWTSSKQVMHLCYTVLGVPPVLDKKTKQPTVGKEAIPRLKKAEPLLAPILERIEEIRKATKSLEVIQKPHDPVDSRHHSNFTPCGAVSFRYTSSSDAFNFSGNAQNISSGDEDK